MAIDSEISRVAFAGNGSTVDFVFPYAFQFAEDLDVYIVDTVTRLSTLQTLTTNYTVAGTANPLDPAHPIFDTGGTVTMLVTPSVTKIVVIIRNVPDTQDTELINGGAYSSAVIEAALDKLAMMTQYLKDRSDRSIRLTDACQDVITLTLPEDIVADSTIAIDPTGTFLVMGPTVSDIEDGVDDAAASALAAAASESAAAASASSASASAISAAASAVTAAGLAAAVANFQGQQYIPETTFTLVNNQVAAANVTGLLFSGALVRSAEIDVTFYRNTTGGGATELSARGKLLATFKTVAASWDLSYVGVDGDIDSGTGTPAGILLSITSAGQVQYTSTNITGTAATSKMSFRAATMGV